MFIATVEITLMRALAQAMATALKTVPGGALLLTPFVKLFTANSAPITPDSEIAQFTEAAFVGYAPAALTLSSAVNFDSNTVGIHGEVNFTGGAVVPPGEVILGYYIVDDDSAPTTLYAAETFENPITITQPGDFISLDVCFPVKMTVTV